MDITICDCCGEKIPGVYDTLREGTLVGPQGTTLRIPLFTDDEKLKWKFEKIDLCVICSRDFSRAYVDLKNRCAARKR